VTGTDRAIRATTAAAVIAVAGIAAYVSYWHAYQVVRAHGESGVTARLEPATIDGLVYASSMVVLYAARHRLPVPGLARWLLALGIAATLAANVAQGWSHGPVGAVVAAWPAASLVGSYELLVWLIRTAGPHQHPAVAPADQRTGPADQSGVQPEVAPGLAPPLATPAGTAAMDHSRCPAWRFASPLAAASRATCGIARTGTLTGPGRWSATRSATAPGKAVRDVDDAAVAVYRVSLQEGKPLSERKLAAMFGKTSRRWARSRMAEARHPSGAMAVAARNGARQAA
jgi:hypothetical protein